MSSFGQVMPHILTHGHLFQPLGSVKAMRNRANDIDFVHMNFRLAFLADTNLRNQALHLYNLHRENGGTKTAAYFLHNIVKWAHKYLTEHDINSYVDTTYQATGQHNWAMMGAAINNEFMKFCYAQIRWNRMIPGREWITVGPTDNRQQKPGRDMTAQDFSTLDYSNEESTYRTNRVYRDNNRIPPWQASLHRRNYDMKNSDGFAYRNPERASLVNPIYGGFDMSAIHAVFNIWQKPEWRR